MTSLEYLRGEKEIKQNRKYDNLIPVYDNKKNIIGWIPADRIKQ